MSAAPAITKTCVRCDAAIVAPMLAATEAERCARCGDDAAAEPKTIGHVRAILARRATGVLTLCADGCEGWAVFDTVRGPEIQTCDECNVLEPDPEFHLTDDDVAQLPEAQRALARASALCLLCGGDHCPHYSCAPASGHCDLCTDGE